MRINPSLDLVAASAIVVAVKPQIAPQVLPTLKRLHVRNLPPKTDDFRTLLNNVRDAVDRVEELAQVIFFLAVRDVLPETLARFEGRTWINTEAISLDPARWERDGLFAPKSAPRDYTALEAEIGRLFVDTQVPAAV